MIGKRGWGMKKGCQEMMDAVGEEYRRRVKMSRKNGGGGEGGKCGREKVEEERYDKLKYKDCLRLDIEDTEDYGKEEEKRMKREANEKKNK